MAKNVGMVKLNRDRSAPDTDKINPNVSVGLGYGHNHPESQRTRVVRRGGQFFGGLGERGGRGAANGSAGAHVGGWTLLGYNELTQDLGNYWCDHTTESCSLGINMPNWSHGTRRGSQAYRGYDRPANNFGLLDILEGRRDTSNWANTEASLQDKMALIELGNERKGDRMYGDFGAARGARLNTDPLLGAGYGPGIQSAANRGDNINPYAVTVGPARFKEGWYGEGGVRNICEPPAIDTWGGEGGRGGKYGQDDSPKLIKQGISAYPDDISGDTSTKYTSTWMGNGGCLPRGILPGMANSAYKPSNFLQDSTVIDPRALDEITLPLHPDRKNMTIQQLQEDAAQKCTEKINTFLYDGTYPEEWRNNIGFILDTPATRMYTTPEGLIDEASIRQLSLSMDAEAHTKKNQVAGTGLRPNFSTTSDGNVNKPWVCEPRVNLPKEITSSETEALIVSGIDMFELSRANPMYVDVGSGREEYYRGGIHDMSTDGRCQYGSISWRFSGEDMFSDIRRADTTSTSWITNKCKIVDGSAQSGKEDAAAHEITAANDKCQALLDESNNHTYYGNNTGVGGYTHVLAEGSCLTAEGAAEAGLDRPCKRLTERPGMEGSGVWDGTIGASWGTGGSGWNAPNYTWSGRQHTIDTSKRPPIANRSGSGLSRACRNNGPDGVRNPLTNWLTGASEKYLAVSEDEEARDYENIGSWSKDKGGGGAPGSGADISKIFSDTCESGRLDTNCTMTSETGADVPVAKQVKKDLQACGRSAGNQYMGNQGGTGGGERRDNGCNFWPNDANGKYVRLIGQDINGQPHYAKADLSWHIYYKCDDLWSHDVCRPGGQRIGMVKTNQSTEAQEYLSGDNYGPHDSPAPGLTAGLQFPRPDQKLPKEAVGNPGPPQTIQEAQKNLYPDHHNTEKTGPFRIPAQEGGISDGALREVMINGTVGADGIEPQPCCGWTIVPHHALYINMTKNHKSVIDGSIYDPTLDAARNNLKAQYYGGRGNAGGVGSLLARQGVPGYSANDATHIAQDDPTSTSYAARAAILGVRSHTQSTDIHGGLLGRGRPAGVIDYNTSVKSKNRYDSDFTAIFAPSNKPKDGPPETGWEINLAAPDHRHWSRAVAPHVKVTRTIDKDHTHRVCGYSEDHNAVEGAYGGSWFNQNIDGYKKDSVIPESVLGNDEYDRWDVMSKVQTNIGAVNPQESRQYRNYSSPTGKGFACPTSTESNTVDDSSRLQDKEFFLLYDDTAARLSERCTSLRIDTNDPTCTLDTVNDKEALRESLNLPLNAEEVDVNAARQRREDIVRADPALEADLLPTPRIPSAPDTEIWPQVSEEELNRLDNEVATRAQTTAIITTRTSAEDLVRVLRLDLQTAANNWRNIGTGQDGPGGQSDLVTAGLVNVCSDSTYEDQISCTNAGERWIEGFNNIEGFTNDDLIEGLCSAPTGQDQTSANAIMDQSICESAGSCSDGSSGLESECTATWTSNAYTWNTEQALSQMIYERTNDLLNRALGVFAAGETHLNDLREIQNPGEAQTISNTYSLSLTNLQDEVNELRGEDGTGGLRQSLTTSAENIICNRISNSLPTYKCITQHQSDCVGAAEGDGEGGCETYEWPSTCTDPDGGTVCAEQFAAAAAQDKATCSALGDSCVFRPAHKKCIWVDLGADGGRCITKNYDNQLSPENPGCSSLDSQTCGEEEKCSWMSTSGEWDLRDCQNFLQSVKNRGTEMRQDCEVDGLFDPPTSSNLSKKCLQNPDQSPVNRNILDISSIGNYLENCANNINKCGNIDDNNPPNSYNDYLTEYNTLKDDFTQAKVKFNKIINNEKNRLNLYKKLYGSKNYYQGYRHPEDIDSYPVSDFLSETPAWLTNIHTSKITNKNNLVTEDNTKETTIAGLKSSISETQNEIQIRQNDLNSLDAEISNLIEKKNELNQRPVSCRECRPCVKCKKCMTLSSFKSANQCSACPSCTEEVNQEIRTQTNICENDKFSLLNNMDQTLQEKSKDYENTQELNEKNSKVSVLKRKKILSLASERNCLSDKVITDISKNETLNNIRKYQLKNDELKEKIEWERNISWWDKFKGVTKPFKATRDYTFTPINTSVPSIDISR